MMPILGNIDVLKHFYLLAKRYLREYWQRLTLESNYTSTTATICLQSYLLCAYIYTQITNSFDLLSFLFIVKVVLFVFFFFFFYCLLFIKRKKLYECSKHEIVIFVIDFIKDTGSYLSETNKIPVNLALFYFLFRLFHHLYSSFFLSLVERTALENEEKTRPMNRDNDNHNAKIFFPSFSLSLCFLLRDYSTTLLFTCSSIYRQNIGILKKNYNIFL